MSELSEISEILTCDICSCTPTDPVLCKESSKLVCKSCLEPGKQSVACPDLKDVIETLNNVPEFRASERTASSRVSSRDKSVAESTTTKQKRQSIERRNFKGETALHRAAMKGDYDQCQALIFDSHPVNCADNAGWTPLHEACAHGHNTIAKLLLENGADPNARSIDGDCPLHDAAVNDALSCAELLLKHGADPNLRNNLNFRPVDICTSDEMKQIITEGPCTSDVEVPSDNRLDADDSLIISWTGFKSSGIPELVRLCRQFADKLSLSKTQPKVTWAALSARTTHLICCVNDNNVAKRTVNFLKGIVYGCEVVSIEWLKASIEASRPVECGPYLIPGTEKDPSSNGAYRRLQANPKECRLLAGWQFFLVGRFNNLGRDQLTSLLTSAQARVLRKVPDGQTWKACDTPDAPNGVHILYDRGQCGRSLPSLPVNWPENVPFKFVAVDWLCDSIERYELLPTT